MSQLGFYFDSTKCIGCRTCMMACKDKNDTPEDIHYRKVTATEGGEFPYPWLYFVSMSCNHCSNPKCVEACPYGASVKRKSDGIVLVNQEICTGCETCVSACPYNARKLNKKTKKMSKCNACIELWARNQNGEKPQCVTACGVRCLDFGEINALKAKYDGLGDIKTLPDPLLTMPSLLIKPTVYGRK